MKLELVAGDPCKVEQIVDEARQVLNLALNRLPRSGSRRRGPVQQLHREPYRRQRIAKLVRERGEELGLLLIRLAQRAFAIGERTFGGGPGIQ
jgi:hypothetical protein